MRTMDPDDPIQQLLKSTGWSCDDLLEKLQKLKSSSNTASLNEQPALQTDTKNAEEGSNNSPTPENEPQITVTKEKVAVGSNKDSNPTITDTKSAENFSDTDEEESEINATNSSIINEIIDDISTIDTVKPSTVTPSTSFEKTEIKEVAVVEINEEENVAEPENPENSIFETITIETEPPEAERDEEAAKRVRYVEIHPRKNFKVLQGGLGNSPFKKLPVTPHGMVSANKTYKLIAPKKPIQVSTKEIANLPTAQNRTLFLHVSPKSARMEKGINEKIIRRVKKIPINAKYFYSDPKNSQKMFKKNFTSNTNEGLEEIITVRKEFPPTSRKTYATKISLQEDAKKTSLLPGKCILIQGQSKQEKTKKPLLTPKKPEELFESRSPPKEFEEDGTTNSTKNPPTKNPSDLFVLHGPSRGSEPPPVFIPGKPSDLFGSEDKSTLATKKPLPVITLRKPNDLFGLHEESVGDKSTPATNKSGEDATKKVFLRDQFGTSKATEEDGARKLPSALLTLRQPRDLFGLHQSNDLIRPRKSRDLFGLRDLPEEPEANEPSSTVKSDLPGTKPTLLERMRIPDTEVDEVQSLKNLEDLRNSLKMQLNSLRTRKNNQFLASPSNKVVEPIERSKKLSLIAAQEEERTIEDTENGGKEEKSTEKEAENVKDLCMQTNELGLVISDVQGGIELEDAEGNEKKDSEDERSTEDAERIGVFDQIRKIINKQKSRTPSRKILPKQNEEAKKTDVSSTSGDNSQSSFTELSQSSLIESAEMEEKSPFVSDTLDEFLTASRLNISYQVPKSGAEEGIKRIEEESLKKESPLILKKVETIKEPKEKKLKSNVIIKAKTVAQKRRILERERRKELKRLERANNRELKAKLVKEETKDPNRSFILFNDNKIYVNSDYSRKCLATINCSKDFIKKTFPNSNQKKKLSLLHQDRKKKHEIRFKPGPLSKKRNLQISGNEKWDIQLAKLPQISLEVEPKPGRRFCDEILHRFQSIIGGELDSNKIDFALSMVRTKTEIDKESFAFPLRYRNKVESVLTRRKKTIITPKPEELAKEIKTSKDPIADVMEDLIRYVEIKELAPTLIKQEESRAIVEDKPTNKLPPSPVSDDNVSVFKKPHRKRSRIETELLRLSCKVVNVEVEETVQESCKKPHCALGCVCKSLKCEYVATYHCQKVACMFECTCPKEKPLVYDKLTLPAGTNILSEDAVTRIEDEAKKNLAKVEREFTQTVIHTNDKTIVVGIGSRSKARRSAKIPAKFTDFVPSEEAICDQDKFAIKCMVRLPKLNLGKIIPYCLIHNLYDCYCKGLAVYTPKNESLRLRPKHHGSDTKTELPVPQFFPIVDKQPVKKKILKEKKSDPIYVPGDLETSSNSNDSWSPLKRPVRNIKKRSFSDEFVENDLVPVPKVCTRVKPVSKKYLKSYKYTEEVFKSDFIYNVTDSDVFKMKLHRSDPSAEPTEAELLKEALVLEKMSEQMTKSRSKRKQVLTSRSDEILTPKHPKRFKEDPALQRRKKIPAKSVFDGEIIIDKQNMDLLKKMGPKTVADGYARLLPWVCLMDGFHRNTINIWSMVDQPSRLLINKSDKKCPKNYINIKETTQMTEVILWILKNKLPDHYQEDSLSFILKETKDNFEICGICTKNITETMEEAMHMNQTEEVDENREIFYHKDLNGIERFFYLNKETGLSVSYRMMRENDDKLESCLDKSSIWAQLPNATKACKWRMVFLNSDFTYLFFNSTKYSIRYTDLMYVAEFAKKHKCTVSIKNEDLQKDSNHEEFGIYFDAKHSDRMFIGPYFRLKKTVSDVETLRYINKSLVSTESFNRMRGKGDYKCGEWLVQARHVATPKSDPTIDLTDDSGLNAHSISSTIMHNDQMIKIVDAPPRKPEDFNRYVVTNIPWFGYLGAYQHANGELDVSWPFENKLLRFGDESLAVSFLEDRFGALLQPVPESFKIVISVEGEIDLETQKPINSTVLNGHFICGEFGYYNITLLSDEACRAKVNLSKPEILKMFAQRAQTFVRRKIEHLAEILNISKNSMGGYQLTDVLNKATSEIVSLMKKEQENLRIKNRLFLKKRENALALHAILSTLPPEKRNLENLKFRAILHKTEPIEIPDSDEETNKSDNGKEKKKAPTLTSDSSPKVFKSPTPLTYPNRTKLKSILKPLVSVPVDRATSMLVRGTPPGPKSDHAGSNSKVIKGIKLVKTSSGYLLVSDETKKQPLKTNVVIQDGKIKSVSGTSTSTLEEKKKIEDTVVIDLEEEQNEEISGSIADEVILEKIEGRVEESDKSNLKVTQFSEEKPPESESAIIDLDLTSEDDDNQSDSSSDLSKMDANVIDLDGTSEEEGEEEIDDQKMTGGILVKDEEESSPSRRVIEEVIDVDALEETEDDKKESPEEDPLASADAETEGTDQSRMSLEKYEEYSLASGDEEKDFVYVS